MLLRRLVLNVVGWRRRVGVIVAGSEFRVIALCRDDIPVVGNRSG